MNYRQSLEYMASLGRYGIIPGLDSIRALCEQLGNPQERLQFIHIAGTNGKGSTLAYISTILRCAKYRVGRYISPVVKDYREKIQINEKNITQKALCEGVTLLRTCCEQLVAAGKPHPTTFEVETALAFWYFEKMNCDYVVLETGMGGLTDATNVIVNTKVAVLASIGMDHMQYLGNTLTEIAAQKVGIVKPGCIVVSLRQKDAVMRVVQDVVGKNRCSLQIADREKVSHVRYGVLKQRFDYGPFRKLEIGLAGSYQIENAILAVEAIQALKTVGAHISDEALYQGLAQTRWFGRFSVLAKKPLFVVDGAHNEDAARKLSESIAFYFTNKRIIYIMGILKDKEYDKIIALTSRYADQILTVTPPDNPRALPAYELAKEIAKVHPAVTAVDSLEEAVEMSYLLAKEDDVILAFGSLSYLGRLEEIVKKRFEKGLC